MVVNTVKRLEGTYYVAKIYIDNNLNHVLGKDEVAWIFVRWIIVQRKTIIIQLWLFGLRLKPFFETAQAASK